MLQHNRAGFTLVEILIVMAILALLMAITLPAIQQTRETARLTQCRSNLRQIGVALSAYLDSHGSFPSGYVYASDGSSGGWGWATFLLPQLDPRWSEVGEFNLPLWEPSNEPLVARHVPAFLCPSDVHSATGFIEREGRRYAMASYAANFGPGDMSLDPMDRRGVFSRNSATRMADIVDGPSHTLAIAERHNGSYPTIDPNSLARGGQIPTSTAANGGTGLPEDSNPLACTGCIHPPLGSNDGSSYISNLTMETIWAGAIKLEPNFDHPETTLFDTQHRPNGLYRSPSSIATHHAGGQVLALFCDGSVRAISPDMDMNTFQALSTRDGEELLRAW